MDLLNKLKNIFYPSPELKKEKEYTKREKKFGYINNIREYDGFEDNMNLKLYLFKAIYSETNRKRTSKITAKDEKHAKELILKQGFIEPIELQRINYEPATERQIAFMESEKMFIPKHFCKEDASAIISNYCDNDPSPNPGLIEFAKEKNINFSYFSGKRLMYNIVFANLETADRIAFFIFSIYRYYSNNREANLNKSPYKDIFYNFALENLNNDSFLKSMNNNYSGQDLRMFGTFVANGHEYYGSSTKTAAFKTAMNYLTDKLGVKYVPKKEI